MVTNNWMSFSLRDRGRSGSYAFQRCSTTVSAPQLRHPTSLLPINEGIAPHIRIGARWGALNPDQSILDPSHSLVSSKIGKAGQVHAIKA